MNLNNFVYYVEEAENYGNHGKHVNLADPTKDADAGPGNHAGRANNLYIYYKWD